MKKFLFGLAAIALAVSSCSQDEEISSDLSTRKGISFGVYTQLTARGKAAQDYTTENLDSFKVAAIGNYAVYFKSAMFNKITEAGEYEGHWASTPLFFYPKYDLNFYAYGPLTLDAPTDTVVTVTPDKEATTDKDEETVTIFYRTPAKMADQSDFVTSTLNVKVADQAQKKNLTFNHILSKVVVKATNQNSAYTVQVKSVKFANLVNEGTYTFKVGEAGTMAFSHLLRNWGDATNVNAACVDYVESFTAKTLDTDATEVMSDGGDGRWYLIPQTWDNYVTDGVNTANPKAGDVINYYGAQKPETRTYLAVLAKITTKQGALVYPSTAHKEEGDNIDADGFGWICIPLQTRTSVTEGASSLTSLAKFEQGKSYTLTVNFFSKEGEGAGVADPEAPAAPFKPGENVVTTGNAITFNVNEVVEWKEVTVGINL